MFIPHLCHAALASCLSLSPAASLQQELFFTEYQFNNPKISAINFDGSNLHELFTIPTARWLPLGLAVNPATERIYWCDSTSPSLELMSAGVSGTPAPAPVIAISANANRGASLDNSGRIYFTVTNTIRRVNADGSGLTTLITTPAAGTIGAPCVDATNGHVYFPYLHQIRRMDLDGANLKTVVRGISNPRAIQLDIATNSIYWIDADTISDYLGRARLDDTEFTIIHDRSPSVVQSSGLIDLLLHDLGSKIYVADELANTIYSMNLDGSDALPFYTSPAGLTPSGLALSTGAPAQPVMDCDADSVPDAQQIASNPALDCNDNGFLDACEANPCPEDALLLDTGSNAASSQGRALGAPSSWEQFQPFSVPVGGWTIARIGVDGFTTNYHDGSGFSLTLWPDDGTGTAPNENGSPLAAAPNLNLRFDTESENWVYADLDTVQLPAGLFWLRLTAHQPATFAASVNSGFTGLPSRFRGSSGILQTAAAPIAVRIFAGDLCAADFDGNGVREVPDIFAFLSAWFAMDPSADFDGTPGIAVPDIFAFLSLWFAGC